MSTSCTHWIRANQLPSRTCLSRFLLSAFLANNYTLLLLLLLSTLLKQCPQFQLNAASRIELVMHSFSSLAISN